MGEKPAAIVGDFSNYKPILGRKVLALSIEVPIERAGEVFAALGYPTGGGGIPVAIALLREEPEPEPRQEEEEKPKLSRAVRQAGIACKEPEFWEFLSPMGHCSNEEDAASRVRFYLGVRSRSEIKLGSDAEHRWNDLLLRYGAWRQEKRRLRKQGGAADAV